VNLINVAIKTYLIYTLVDKKKESSSVIDILPLEEVDKHLKRQTLLLKKNSSAICQKVFPL